MAFKARWTLLGACLLAPGGVAWAGGPSAADKDAARSLMDQGEDQVDRGDLEGALKSFLAADAIMHVPTTGIEVARTEAALGMLLEAQEAARAVARSPAKRGEPRPFTAARDAAKALDEDLDRRIPAIAVDVQPGARVLLDGTELPAQDAAPGGLARKVDPGHHVLEAHAGDASARAEVDVAERESKTVTLKLVAPRPAVVTAPVPAPRSPETEPAKQRVSGLAIAGFAAGGAGVATGAITGVLVLTRAGDLHDTCNVPGGPPKTCTGSSADKLSSTKTLATVSTVAFIVGGAGIATGTLALLLDKPARPTRAQLAPPMLAIRPWIGVASAGLDGRF